MAALTGDGSDPGSDSDGDNSRYDKQHYWDARFEREDGYEWLCGFEHVRHLLEEEFPAAEWRDARILVLGCGNSPFSQQLHVAGYGHVVSCDFSAVVIEKMRARHAHLRWEVADVRALGARFAEHAFDLVIDKACLDALVCNEGDPWDPDAEVVENMTAALRSVVHVLRPGGVFVSIGFQQPHFRKRYLRREGQTFGWEENIVVKKIDAGLGYFWYSCPLSHESIGGGGGGGGGDGMGGNQIGNGESRGDIGGGDGGGGRGDNEQEDSCSEDDDSEEEEDDDGPNPELSAETLALLASMGLASKTEER
jgi:SAM-dependent methyltransferase